MPELPELQAHAERLDTAYAGARLERFEALSPTGLKTVAPSPDAAAGTPLAFVGRRGKYLLLDHGVATFVVHLMQGGRLRPDPRAARRPRGGLARLHYEERPPLLLTEAGTERRAGVWVVADDPEQQPPLDELGPDADRVDAAALAALLHGRATRIHTLLRDQRVLAGLGRRLANEVCHRARVSPFAPARSLATGDGPARLAEAIRVCVAEGLAHERGLDEMGSAADRPGAVHGRAGEPCPGCGATVRAVEYRDYTVCYCPDCQTGGRLLADNTTSRFLK